MLSEAEIRCGASGVDRTRGLPHTKRLLNQLSFEGAIKFGAHTMGSNLGPLAYKASALTN
jgi:hypothetical protein